MLVNSEPGPSVIRSALAMASRVSGSGLDPPRIERDAPDGDRAAADERFPFYLVSVGERRLQNHVGGVDG